MGLQKKVTGRGYYAMLLPMAVLLLLFIYYPIVRGMGTAFMHYTMMNLSLTRFNGLENFVAIFANPNIKFLQILGNTALWVVFSLAGQFILGFTLALLLRKPFKGRGVYTGCVFYTWALSGFAIGLLWSWLFNGQFGIVNDLFMKAGLLKTPVGFLSNPRYALPSVIVANIWYGIPFFAIMLLAALQSVPRELYESAEIDGAGKARQLFQITIPYIKSTITTTILLRFMWIMNFPDVIYGMTGGGPANSTNILATEMINKITKSYDFGQGSAVGLIIVVILFIFAFFYLRVVAKKELSL
ncbi:carbohydrate ABC transporter permease [Leadbettera azotonutricia]|uniref:ABC transporter, permease protein n=1 Tax=Leadbettera azotonutricia (strain ATCC BAA-888 / DSM 13862 / ZAS-9) TaxID=545695 RepID=F5YEC6_LEAAZ|nr:sugar ABC transporter permease [Leadbettera azotonutricia]AEF82487.1 ABC transporter, permease protein [Leadbettera azotonutricia ZAS-9]